MKSIDWIKVEDRLPVPTDGEDFLVKLRGLEEDYAYAWYAYDRQCFMCYATGLSLALAPTHWMPIEPPKEDRV